jgi:hypothetical protein
MLDKPAYTSPFNASETIEARSKFVIWRLSLCYKELNDPLFDDETYKRNLEQEFHDLTAELEFLVIMLREFERFYGFRVQS